MIRSFYGISDNPFSLENLTLLPAQQEIYDTLIVHNNQGGFCLVMGMPGTGKSVIKEFLNNNASKQTLVVIINRTLHTYTNTTKILCQAFHVEFAASSFKCEKKLIEEANSLKRQGKNIVIIIDEAHWMDIDTLRRLRLLFEEFPKNHNVILIGQPELLNNINLSVNQDIKSRVTYSIITKRLNPDDMKAFILAQLDRVKLGHNTFSDDALELIVRSCEGVLRRSRNLCLSCMLEAVRQRNKIIGLETVNRVLIQPHWRKDQDMQNIY
jgi:type II secretory pathway predicted ATPase ExeA